MKKNIKSIESFDSKLIRNFSVIAHIDHGKSTLSDRLLEFTGTLSSRVKNEQFLDKLQVEKERGITVKAQTASMFYESKKKNKTYLLNLIDTPGHVDFSYEVSRSLSACQGVLLIVDATQGVQAQTVANFYKAFELDLVVIPVINKIDVESADVDRVSSELESLFDFKKEDCILVSAKTGVGIEELLETVVEKINPPIINLEENPRALLFDSWYDEYKGVIALIAVDSGSIKKGDVICTYQTGSEYEVLDIGIMYPGETSTGVLSAGQVGYIITGMKTVKEACIGDTIHVKKKEVSVFPGFRPPKPMVFAGIFPVDSEDFEDLRDSIEKLTLNDSSVSVEKTHSNALGMGFRCGFLGLLHMEVFQQRIEQEHDVSVITTAPSVLYKLKLKDGQELDIESPSEFPDQVKIESIKEPKIKATIMLNKKDVGSVMELCQKKRGEQIDFVYLSEDRAILTYLLPLNEVATDFYDKLKSITSGYASFDYEDAGYVESRLVKMDILINGKPVDALSVIVHEDSARNTGIYLVDLLIESIGRQMYDIAIQAAIGSNILARRNKSAFRKDVVAHCYGGDVTRKKKLREKQKAGKKKMKQLGSVEVPKEAFLLVLKRS